VANLLHGYASAEVFEPGFLAGVDPTAPTAKLSHSWWLSDGASQVNQLIALDMQYALADQQLPAAAAPFGHWLQSEPRIKALAFDSLAHLKRRGIVREAFIDTLLTARMAQNPAWHGRMVWLLMMLEQWFGQRRFRALHAPLMRRTADEPQACGQ
jgi:hypothetical protein